MAHTLAIITLVVLAAFEIACMVEIVRMDRKASKQEASREDLS